MKTHTSALANTKAVTAAVHPRSNSSSARQGCTQQQYRGCVHRCTSTDTVCAPDSMTETSACCSGGGGGSSGRAALLNAPLLRTAAAACLCALSIGWLIGGACAVVLELILLLVLFCHLQALTHGTNNHNQHPRPCLRTKQAFGACTASQRPQGKTVQLWAPAGRTRTSCRNQSGEGPALLWNTRTCSSKE